MSLEVKVLPSGYIRIALNTQIWAQVPPHFDWRSGIPPEFCFQPAWSYKRLNSAIYQALGVK